MGLKVGTTDITAVYVGSSSVLRGFIGSSQWFGEPYTPPTTPHLGYITADYVSGSEKYVDKVNLDNESVSGLGNVLPDYGTFGATATASAKGYLFGGKVSSTYYSNIQSVTYSNDTFTKLSTALSQTKSISFGLSTLNYSYILAGETGKSVYTDRVEKFAISGETISTVSNVLSQAYNGRTSVQSSTTGYLLGGEAQSGWYYAVHRFSFTTESGNFCSTNLTNQSYNSSSSVGDTCGYRYCAYTTSERNINISTYTYATEAEANLTATLNTAKWIPATVQTSAKTLVCGGSYASSNNDIDRFTHSTQTSEHLSITTVSDIYDNRSVSNWL